MIPINSPDFKPKHKVSDFEYALTEYLRFPYAVATNSGTSALHLALMDIGIKPGDKVGVPALCFRAVVNAVLYTGAFPVFYDTFPKDINGFPEQTQDLKALIVVYNYGFSFTWSGQNIPVIEDISEALGNGYTGAGDYLVCSFNWNKIVSCGSGGMVLCRSGKSAETMRRAANQGKRDSVYFVHDPIGYNYRMNDLQASLGMETFSQLETNLLKKKLIYQNYKTAGLPLVTPGENSYYNYWITLLKTAKMKRVINEFQQNDIEARAMWKPHLPLFNATIAASEICCLPSSPSLTELEQRKVIEVVRNII